VLRRVVQILGNGPGDGDTVEGGCPPADLVKDNQAAGGGVAQDIGGFGHLQHEGGLTAGQVVGGTDAGENPVGYADLRPPGRDEAPGLGHEGYQGDLTHEGGFTGHVGTGDDQQLVVAPVKEDIVCNETLPQVERLNNRMTAVGDGDDIPVVHSRATVIGLVGKPRQRKKNIQGGQQVGCPGYPPPLLGNPDPDILEKGVLQLGNTVFRAEHLLFVLLQFRRYEPLGIGKGLAADIVGRDVGQIGFRHLDVVAEDLVIADLQGADAGAGLFLRLQPGDEPLPLAADTAQLIQFPVVAIGNHPAVPQDKGRILRNRRPDEAGNIRQRVDGNDGLGQEWGSAASGGGNNGRNSLQRIPQGNHVLGRSRRKADSAVQPLQVVHPLQRGRDSPTSGRVGNQLLHGIVTPENQLHRHERIVDPLLEFTCPHGGDRVIHQPKERPPPLAVGHGSGQLQISPGGVIQHEKLAALVGDQLPQMQRPPLLRLLQVVQNGSGGRSRQLHRSAERLRRHAELIVEQPAGIVPVIGPVIHEGQQRGDIQLQGAVQGSVPADGRQEKLPRSHACRLCHGGGAPLHFGGTEMTGGEIEAGQAEQVVPTRDKGKEEIILLRREGIRIDHESRRYDLDNLAPDDPLDRFGILHLLAYGHFFAGFDQFGNVGVGRVVGDAAERHFPPFGILVAGGQGYVEDTRRLDRIIEKHLVEVAQTEEEYGILIAGLDLKVLAHHRGKFGHCGHGECSFQAEK